MENRTYSKFDYNYYYKKRTLYVGNLQEEFLPYSNTEASQILIILS